MKKNNGTKAVLQMIMLACAGFAVLCYFDKDVRKKISETILSQKILEYIHLGRKESREETQNADKADGQADRQETTGTDMTAPKKTAGTKQDDFIETTAENLSEQTEKGNTSKEITTETIKNDKQETDKQETEKQEDNRIRVLLSEDGGYYQTDISLTCDTDFSVNYGKTIVCYSADTVITEEDIHKYGKEDFTQCVASPNSEAGKITLLCMEKSGENPSYRGSMYIKNDERGYYFVNELPLEEYLYGVVSSEMPSSYHMEALKAQAVCARGYALRKMAEEKYREYGADIDDTTSCQVYNNIPETERTISAVQETMGLVPTYDGEIIDAYYFSTSCGLTCSNTAVWQGEKKPYLNNKLETTEKIDADEEVDAVTVMTANIEYDFSSERDFAEFMDNQIYSESVEKSLPLYRWTVEFDNEAIADFASEETSVEIGAVRQVFVSKRDDSGIVCEITVQGEKGEVVVEGQQSVRAFFSPAQTTIKGHKGDCYTGWSMLPSSFFYIEDKADGGIVLHGGGFGHGVGMSQNGANELGNQGWTFDKILKRYYDGITIEKMQGAVE